MMEVKKISFIVDPHQSQNRIFDYSPTNPVNRDNGVYPFYLLKKMLSELGIEISTHDILNPESADLLIFLDVPRNLKSFPAEKKKYLIITESQLIKPHNWDLAGHVHFQKIFTWNDDFVDNVKYFKLNFSNKIETTPVDNQLRPQFCCLVAGAKKNSHPLELYSKRVEAIRWFEENAPKDFDLYGIGWDLFEFTGPIFIRVLNRIKILRSLFAEKFPSYKGRIESKRTTMRQYQFSICFENAQGIPGYITEKIFDSMFAGCIPVYWGAPNIEKFIPKNCYIDKTDFNTYDELYTFMKGLSLGQIQEYQRNIISYLNSESSYDFSAEAYAETICQNILNDRGNIRG